jgi:exodeoxyribonuclease VII large subunit
MDDDFPPAESGLLATESPGDNAAPFSVSELAMRLKRTVEDAFGFVRVRGEISGWKQAASGHCYLCLKDDKAVLDGVLWKANAAALGFRPEDGIEVVATGRLTTYPGRSRYQIVIERLELAGQGALMALLDKRRRALAAEGLFDEARKQRLPFLPRVIGVVTSPTGAVIRDILHRLADRCPCHVLVWPVQVQGEGAAAQVAAALRGFDALPAGGPIPRPDLLIVARGGGSIEDLWAFNEEEVVRAVAAASIPIISAVGHETDTSLCDFAADVRAPTPTAAAEMATPVLADLKAAVSDLGARMHRCGGRAVEDRRGRVEAAGRALGRVPDLLRLAEQRFDIVSGRLAAGLARNAAAHERELVRVSARLTPLLLQRPQAVQRQRLDGVAQRLQPGVLRALERAGERFSALSKLYASVDPERPLQRGFARVTRVDGSIVHAGAVLASGEEVAIKFGDQVTRQAVIDGSGGEAAAAKPARGKPKASPVAQGDLF